ncbi:MAG: hypothetical protein Q7S92_06850 [Candidatus Diapherotrites archaeon]|nr:hypothetical protein [Candidatus Diapherotrites archaeon]
MKPKFSGKGILSKKHGAVLSRLLKGKQKRAIARELNLSEAGVETRLNILWPYLGESTQQLIESRRRSSKTEKPTLDSKKLIDSLDRELESNPNLSTLKKLAEEFKVKPAVILHELKLAGVFFKPELARKWLEFWKEVARVRKLHLVDQAQVLRISPEKVRKLQRRFQQGFQIKEMRTFLKELTRAGWWKSDYRSKLGGRAIQKRDWQVKEDLALLNSLAEASSETYAALMGSLFNQYAIQEYAFRKKNKLPIPKLIATIVEVDST